MVVNVYFEEKDYGDNGEYVSSLLFFWKLR